jgi:hypothetical protein
MRQEDIMPVEAELSPPKEGQRLKDRYPIELEFFKRVFLWTGCRDGFYVRYGYEPQRTGVKPQPKWSPLMSKGGWQHMYPELVDSLAEKHLDFNNYARTRVMGDRLEPKDWETAFWVGTMAGVYTHAHAIDLDAHEYIGWNGLPTRWHTSRTGWVDGPWSYRFVPVIRPSLSFFMKAKVVYDAFPNRIWAFSSGNLGLSVWKLYKQPELTHVIHNRHQNRLCGVGLPTVEHYPLPPKTKGSLGKCHRRPCGLDSGVITPSGVLTNPIEQVRWFMRPQRTPSFDQILSAYWTMLDGMYEEFIDGGEGLDHGWLSVDRRRALVAECMAVVEEVKEWASRGCLIDRAVMELPRPKRTFARVDQDVSAPELVTHIIKETGKWGGKGEGEQAPSVAESVPEQFAQVDISTITMNGEWLHFVKFLVENGVPCEDKFYEVISTLAKWFCFVEFYGRPVEDVSEVIKEYVLNRHNGMVSRINNGDEAEALGQADRIISHVLRTQTEQADRFYEDVRRKRATGRYASSWTFATEIMNGRSSSVDTAPSPQSSLSCGSRIEGGSAPEQKEEWVYEPDDTPLPKFVLERIRAAFGKRKRQLRKIGGRYPTLDAITRFFNYLLAGSRRGQRRASKELLMQMGFPSSGSKRDRILNILIRDGMLRKGGYRSKEASIQWEMSPDVVTACNWTAEH